MPTLIMTNIISQNDEPDYSDGALVEMTKPKLKKPPLYKVLLLNDDYTPMDFVVVLLRSVFALPQEKAMQVMLHVHEKGVGVCGVYTREIAETKVEMVMEFAQSNQHPLQCTMEPESEGEES
ncbi:MAG: ATP-dependent Clp protease adapter ClpS [Arenicella sp.]